MRPTRDQWALGLAKLTAERSTCLRRAVGAVALNARGHVLATGYNGVAAGQPHCNELSIDGYVDGGTLLGPACMPIYKYKHACPGAEAPSGTNLDGCHALHAEQNALLQCRDVWEIETMYVTASPCMTCTKLLLNTGCRRIVFLEEYTHPAAADLWRNAGREWFHYKEKT